VTAGNIVFDPLIETHLVEHLASGGICVVERGKRRGLDLLAQRLVDGREVAVRLARGVISVEEPERVRRVVGLCLDLVGHVEAEALRELQNEMVVGVNQLAAPLAHLAVRPIGGIGVHAAANARRGLVDSRGIARVLERERRGETGNSSADDSDPRGPALSPYGPGQCEGRHSGGTSDKLPAGDAARDAPFGFAGPLFTDDLYRYTARLRHLMDRSELNERTKQWSARHNVRLYT